MSAAIMCAGLSLPALAQTQVPVGGPATPAPAVVAPAIPAAPAAVTPAAVTPAAAPTAAATPAPTPPAPPAAAAAPPPKTAKPKIKVASAASSGVTVVKAAPPPAATTKGRECTRLPLSDIQVGKDKTIEVARMRLGEYATKVAKQKNWKTWDKSQEVVACEDYLNVPILGQEYKCMVTATFCKKS